MDSVSIIDDFQKIALFVDGDNANHKKFTQIYQNIQTYGKMLIRKVYFDFDNKSKWMDICIKHGIEPVLVTNLPSKNSSDIRMITDIMETLYENKLVTTFIILSADSDFSHVANKLRMKGKTVIGIGKSDASKLLISNCDKYIDHETLFEKEDIRKTEFSTNDEHLNDEHLNNEHLNNEHLTDEYFNNVLIQIKSMGKNNYVVNKLDISTKLLSELQKYNKYYKEIGNSIYLLDTIANTISNILKNYDEPLNLGRFKELIMLVDPSFDNWNWNFDSFRHFMEVLFGNKVKIFKGNGRYMSTTFITKK